MVIAGIIFFLNPTQSYPFITAILSLGLLFRGFQLLFFYFRMARFMVDGRSMLYQSIIMIDLGLFTGSLTQVPLVYVMLYLIAINLFSGIFQRTDQRAYGSSLSDIHQGYKVGSNDLRTRRDLFRHNAYSPVVP